MLLLKFSDTDRQSVALILSLVKLCVHTFDLSASLAQMAIRLLEVAANRTKLKANTLCFGASLFQIVRNVRVKGQ